MKKLIIDPWVLVANQLPVPNKLLLFVPFAEPQTVISGVFIPNKDLQPDASGVIGVFKAKAHQVDTSYNISFNVWKDKQYEVLKWMYPPSPSLEAKPHFEEENMYAVAAGAYILAHAEKHKIIDSSELLDTWYRKYMKTRHELEL